MNVDRCVNFVLFVFPKKSVKALWSAALGHNQVSYISTKANTIIGLSPAIQIFNPVCTFGLLFRGG